MGDSKKAKTSIHLDHAALVLRVDEMVRGEDGMRVAKQIGEMHLSRGFTEVDAELWGKWYEQNKDGPLVKGGIVEERKPGDQHGAKVTGDGGAAGSGGADRQ